MESKYLKLPLIEVSNFDKDSILKYVSEDGLYLVTDGDSIALCRVYTCENLDGTVNKWINDVFAVDREDIFETVY